MSLNNIDKTRASRTEDELRALVEAIIESPSRGASITITRTFTPENGM